MSLVGKQSSLVWSNIPSCYPTLPNLFLLKKSTFIADMNVIPICFYLIKKISTL